MAETTMCTKFGDFTVERPNTSVTSPLRAWSAADELALDDLDPARLGRLLIVNDDFGALTCALATAHPTVWTDSALSRHATSHNLVANGLEPLVSERSVRGDEQPSGDFDTVVVRIPKTSALLEHQLRVVASVCGPGAVVVGAGMARHIHSSTVATFENVVGPTTTSRARRKARLIHSKPTGQTMDGVQLAASEFVTSTGLRIAEYPGTFSAGHLDVGSALLLRVLADVPIPEGDPTVADLGCGNGILAAEMAARWTQAHFLLLDVSDLAVAAATETWRANGLGDRMSATAADGFGSMATDSVDVVITNPPFHQGHALDAEMTDRLLGGTARVLRPGGTAYVVAQRHLNLHTRMRQWFSSVEVVSKHPSHVVLVATNPA